MEAHSSDETLGAIAILLFIVAIVKNNLKSSGPSFKMGVPQGSISGPFYSY